MQKLLRNLKLRVKMIVSHGTLGLLALLLMILGIAAITEMIINLGNMYDGPVRCRAITPLSF